MGLFKKIYKTVKRGVEKVIERPTTGVLDIATLGGWSAVGGQKLSDQALDLKRADVFVRRDLGGYGNLALMAGTALATGGTTAAGLGLAGFGTTTAGIIGGVAGAAQFAGQATTTTQSMAEQRDVEKENAIAMAEAAAQNKIAMANREAELKLLKKNIISGSITTSNLGGGSVPTQTYGGIILG